MKQEEINALLEKMLIEPKAKGFLAHLIYNYTPIDKIGEVEDKPKGDFRCAITKERLVSKKEMIKTNQSAEFSDKLKASFLTAFKDDEINKLIGDNKLAVTGKETTTYMSLETAQVFYKWVMDKAANKDKYINSLLNKIKREATEITEKSPLLIEDYKLATFTLSDSNDVLQNLKNKFKDN